jgi:hypothetical protein
MHKQIWREYLTSEGERGFKKLNNNEKAQVVFRVNKKAIQHFKDLILIFEGMHRITRNPDKQFRKILYTDNLLPEFAKEFMLAKQLALEYNQKSLTPYSLSNLMAKLTLKGIPYDVKKLIEDKNYRLDKINDLMEK